MIGVQVLQNRYDGKLLYRVLLKRKRTLHVWSKLTILVNCEARRV